MDDSIDGLHGKPNSTRVIVYENKYDDSGLLIGMNARSEIIRCMDCKYYVSSGWCEGIGTCVSSDDFCSRAERKTDG